MLDVKDDNNSEAKANAGKADIRSDADYWRGWNAHIEWCRYVIEDYWDGKIELNRAILLITGEQIND